MPLSDPNTIDYLGLEKGGGAVIVTLLDDFDGADELRRLALLQAKINRYFDFIESGEVFVKVSQVAGRKVARGTPVRISILAKQQLGDEGERFVRHVTQVGRQTGVDIEFKVLAS